jgi:hypothetical protein
MEAGAKGFPQYGSDALRSIGHTMPAQTACAHCRTIGFVRREHVLNGAASRILYYCGRCNHSWSNTENEPRPTSHINLLPADPPDRSRPS